MYLCKNHLTIPVNNGCCILVHCLTGNMFLLGKKEFEQLKIWENQSEIKPVDDDIDKLVLKLRNNNFIFESPDEEVAIETDILDQCRKRHDSMASKNEYATFVLSYKCNFSCPYCYEKSSNPQDNITMTKDMVDRIFELHNGVINDIMLYGGEPLLLENEQIIRYIISKAPHARYYATTNGYHLEEYFTIFKDINVGNIMVTLDGEKDLHNKTRVLKGVSDSETYTKILNGISLYLENSICIKIRMNISNSNIDSCLKLKQNLINTFDEAYNNGKLLFEMQPLFQLRSIDKMRIEERLYFPQAVNVDKKPMRDNDNTITRSLSPLVSIFSRPQKFYPRYCNCAAEINSRLYDANGDIYSCLLALGNPRAAIGKYYPTFTLKANSMIRRNIETIPECKECKLKFLCGGGCANKVLQSDGNALIPNCAQIQEEIKNVVPALCEKYLEKVK